MTRKIVKNPLTTFLVIHIMIMTIILVTQYSLGRNHMEDNKNTENNKTKETNPSIYISLGMCLGMSLGTSFGLIFDNLPIGLCLGLSMGTAIGTLLSAVAKKDKEKKDNES